MTSRQARTQLLFSLGLVILLTTLLPRSSAQESNTAAQLESDLEQFATELPKLHFNLFAKMSREQFEAEIAKLKNDLPTITGIQFSLRLRQILASIGDGHTQLRQDLSQLSYIPVNFKILDDGIFIRAIDKQHSKALAAKLVGIGALSAEQVVAGIAQLIPHDNRPGLYNVLDNQMNTVEFLQFIGAADGQDTYVLHLEKDGAKFDVQLKPVPSAETKQIQWANAEKKPMMLRVKDRFDYWNDWLADEKTLYFKYNKCRDFLAFNKLANGTIEFVKQNDVQKFVVDLRDNGGGDSRVFLPMIQYLKTNPDLNQQGKLFVITSRKTFSSAVLNTIQLKQNTNAITVGEATGGKPNHFGEIKFLELTNTKLKVQYSTKHFTLIEGSDPDSMVPDITVPMKSADWFAGNDPYLKAVLEYNKE